MIGKKYIICRKKKLHGLIIKIFIHVSIFFFSLFFSRNIIYTIIDINTKIKKIKNKMMKWNKFPSSSGWQSPFWKMAPLGQLHEFALHTVRLPKHSSSIVHCSKMSANIKITENVSHCPIKKLFFCTKLMGIIFSKKKYSLFNFSQSVPSLTWSRWQTHAPWSHMELRITAKHSSGLMHISCSFIFFFFFLWWSETIK